MAQSFISVFVDDNAATAVGVRVPDAILNSGMFAGASNAPGIGISTENPDLQESLFEATDGSGDLVTGSWTLLDQHGNARQSQIGQLLGGPGSVSRIGNQEFTWDKSQALYTDNGAASSGGQEGTLPDATIRLIDPADLPTAAEKEADPNLDGNVTLPAQGAWLETLEAGWIEDPTP